MGLSHLSNRRRAKIGAGGLTEKRVERRQRTHQSLKFLRTRLVGQHRHLQGAHAGFDVGHRGSLVAGPSAGRDHRRAAGTARPPSRRPWQLDRGGTARWPATRGTTGRPRHRHRGNGHNPIDILLVEDNQIDLKGPRNRSLRAVVGNFVDKPARSCQPRRDCRGGRYGQGSLKLLSGPHRFPVANENGQYLNHWLFNGLSAHPTEHFACNWRAQNTIAVCGHVETCRQPKRRSVLSRHARRSRNSAPGNKHRNQKAYGFNRHCSGPKKRPGQAEPVSQ